MTLRLGNNILGLKSLEVGHLHVLHQSVHLLGGLLVLVTASLKANANSLLDVANTLSEHLLVQSGIDSNVPVTIKRQ